MSIIIKSANLPTNCGLCRFGEIYDLADGDDMFVCELDWSLPISISDIDKRHKDCPLEELKERPKGKWEQMPYLVGEIEVKIPYCSECGMSTLSTAWHYPSKFCPNCGAEMERDDG